MNKCSLALSDQEYRQCIGLLRSGFRLKDRTVYPNKRIAGIVVTQATLGLRLGDVLKLKMNSFVNEGGRSRLNIVEEKTCKTRSFTVPVEVYSFLQDYAIEMGIGKEAKLFDLSQRQVHRHLSLVFEYMGLPSESYSSHSFRKYFATKVYLNNDCNIELVRLLLQHSNVAVTQRYIGISQKSIEDALSKTVEHLV